MMNWVAWRAGALAAGMLVAGGRVHAQSAPGVSGSRIQADMQVLSSDSFAGRKPGTPSERMTTDYIIKRFAEAGLAPAAGDGWLQPVKLETRRMQRASLVVRGPGGKATDLSDAVALVGSVGSVALDGVPLAWGGYAREGSAPGGALAGAVVLYRDGDPPGLAQRSRSRPTG